MSPSSWTATDAGRSKRHLPREAGHVAGVNAVRETVRAACDIGLENLTLFAFSSENWKRPKTEVGALMGLFRTYFRSDMDELVERGVRMRIIGNRGARGERHPADDRGCREAAPLSNTGLNLTFAFDYGGQEEIAAAARELARAAAEGRLDPETITPELFAARLFTSALARTRSGDPHQRRAPAVSNFLLWQSAYAELVVRGHAVAGFRPRGIARGAREIRRSANAASAPSSEAVA